MIRSTLALLVVLALPARGQDAASVAFMVQGLIEAPKLGEAALSNDPLVRATAARVAAIRIVDPIVPQLREALGREQSADAAREQIRALVLLGSDDDVAFAAKQLARFPSSLDADFTAAIGRLGAPRAIDLYLHYAPSLRTTDPPVRYALWGRTEYANVTAAKLLGAGDARAFTELLRSANEGSFAIDAGVLTAALGAKSDEIIAATLWYVLRNQAGGIAESVRERAIADREGAKIDEQFARELIRRIGGAKPQSREAWTKWLDTPEARLRVPLTQDFEKYLTSAERRAFSARWLEPWPAQPSFALWPELPPGLAQKIFEETGCRDGWVGNAGAAVERTGRVLELNLTKLRTTRECIKAIDTMMRLSLAEPGSFTAPPISGDLVLARTPNDVSCLDEDPAVNLPARGGGVHPLGGEVKPPTVSMRVEPYVPASALRTMAVGALSVTLAAVITRSGCVREIRVLTPSRSQELNASAVSAFSKWKFKPATLDGVPVDSEFRFAMSFRR